MVTDPSNPKTDLNRLIAAAVIDSEFRTLLLTNPLRAIGQGYYGEYFQLSSEIQAQISSIEAASLSEFAQKLIGFPPCSNSAHSLKSLQKKTMALMDGRNRSEAW